MAMNEVEKPGPMPALFAAMRSANPQILSFFKSKMKTRIEESEDVTDVTEEKEVCKYTTMDAPLIMEMLVHKNRAVWEKRRDKGFSGTQANLIDNYEDFTYIVERKDQSKIAFLSGQDRFPPKKRKPPSPKFMSPDIISGVQAIFKKIRSNRGVGGLADLGSRFAKLRLDDTPGPNRYDPIKKKKIEESEFPFGKTKKEYKTIVSITPGPGTYDPPKQCRRPLKIHSFGGRVHLYPCVETLCVPKAIDECTVCRKICDGDYWHTEYTTCICLKCMRIQKKTQTKFKLHELRRFKKIRNCSFMHQHEGTTAAVRLFPKGILCTKFRKENYLENFFDKYV